MKLDPWHYAVIGAVILLAAWLFQKKHNSCTYCRNRWAQLTGTFPGAGHGAAESDVSASTQINY